MRVWRHFYEFGGFLWWLRGRSVGVLWGGTKICGLECKVQWYFGGCGGFRRFLKSEIEAKTLIVRVSDVGLWLKVGFSGFLMIKVFLKIRYSPLKMTFYDRDDFLRFSATYNHSCTFYFFRFSTFNQKSKSSFHHRPLFLLFSVDRFFLFY